MAPISGVLTGICVSYFVPAAVEWFSMIPFLVLLFWMAETKPGARRALGIGFSYFYPYYLTVWYWFLTMYPLDFTGLTPSAALGAVLAAWLGLPLLQASFAMLQVPLFVLAARSRFAKPMLRPLIFGAIYIFFEWMQTLTWAGVPWGRLAIGQAYVPVFVGAASLFGSYFISFAIVAVNGYAAKAILSVIVHENKKATVSLALAASVFAVNLCLGAVVSILRADDSAEDAVDVAVLQGNISSTDKWKDNSFDNVASVYKRLTDDAAEDGAEIVVWTETVVPYVTNEYPHMLRFFENLASANDVTMFVTSFWQVGEGEDVDVYNAVVTVSPESGVNTENVYRKQRLVPFGEFVPYENLVKKLFPPLAGLDMFDSSVSTGDGAYVALTEHGKVGNLICFDSIYEDYALAAVRDGAELITISTNDSWFGQSAALFQHTGQAVLRAVETDRYVARAANTGYTCIIAPSGEIASAMPIDREGYVTETVYMRSTVTLYSIVGNVIVWIAAALTAVLCFDSLIILLKKKNKRIVYSVRAAVETDMDALVRIYDDGRRSIASLGIDQWQDGYPSRDVIEADVAQGALYVAEDKGRLAAAAVLLPPPDPDYAVIDGAWLTKTENYAVVHRIASSADYLGKGASSALLCELMKLVKADGRESVRMDTHRGNTVMQGFLGRHGFERCGLITLSHGDGDRVRVAYEKVFSETSK